MPVGGGWLTDMSNADAQLWSVAGQLIEAVDFMHQHGVAHLDLKPANILIPKGGGRLSIVDFHTSRRIKGVKTMLHGVVGTPKYIPPRSRPGVAGSISWKLMDVDPEKRPMTSGVLERMADYKGDGDARPQPNSDPMFANISDVSFAPLMDNAWRDVHRASNARVIINLSERRIWIIIWTSVSKIPLDFEKPGFAQHYYVECANTTRTSLQSHWRGEVHKKHCKQLKEPAYTTGEAERAGVLGQGNGPRQRR
ncbi:kinase-like domain-containing protein [Infundibulicybe gibba]|nr:kinase-like domain-containing protein [Infundibulicybe gibba]